MKKFGSNAFIEQSVDNKNKKLLNSRLLSNNSVIPQEIKKKNNTQQLAQKSVFSKVGNFFSSIIPSRKKQNEEPLIKNLN